MSNKLSGSQYFLYVESGFRIMGLHGVTEDGLCGCGDPDCQAILKHPINANWQLTPHWDEEQLETYEEMGWFDNFGVIIDDQLVIDIDPRNGGMDSYHRLVEDTGIDFMAGSGFVVETGGGGWHIYFKDPTGFAYKSVLHDYPGIDFKTNGFVVGAGSMHKSGHRYLIDKGDPGDLTDIPEPLISLLKKNDFHRGVIGSGEFDVPHEELESMLKHIDNQSDDGLHYDDWIMVGMALHHTTAGGDEGFKLWDNWSAQSGKYNPSGMYKKWHSFGKSSNPVTLGTLYHLAEKAGYVAPVSFDMPATYNEEVENSINEKRKEREKPVKPKHGEEAIKPVCPVNIEMVAITNPPRNTLVRQLADHIKQNLRRRRDYLATMAAFSVVGNLAGLRYTDEIGTTTNVFWFGVGDSGTGKDGVISKCQEVYSRLGLGEAVPGAIKSEQEIVRNFVHSQANWYLIDEMGKFLKKLRNAEVKGATSYLENVVGIMMSAYSKTNSVLGISGDLKREVINENKRRIKSLINLIEEGFTDIETIDIHGNKRTISRHEQENSAKMALAQFTQNSEYIKMGIYKPFLSITGLSTSTGFDEYFTKETVVDGFMGRMIVFRENNTAPRLRKDYTGEELPANLFGALSNLFYGGTAKIGSDNERIQRYDPRIVVPSTSDANKLIMELTDYFDDLAEYYAETNGFQALALRAMEAVRKISLILAAPSGLREREHIEYATALVLHDINHKVQMVVHHEGKESKNSDIKGEALIARMLGIATGEPLSRGKIVQRSQSKDFTKEQCEKCFDYLFENGHLELITDKDKRSGAGRATVRYFAKNNN